MRVLALHRDVIVVVAAVWQTTATAVRSPDGQEAFLIDSPVYPDELGALPGVLEQSAFPISALLATHADWDHLLGRLAFPELSLGVATSSAERLAAEPGAAQRELRAFDAHHYVAREAPLTLPAPDPLPVPGRLDLAESPLELHPTPGHTVDGMGVWIPWARVLVCGDYLSPVEIPLAADARAYLATLERLRPLVEAAEHVVPGHGPPLTGARAREILEEDRAYLHSLLNEGGDAALPPTRRSPRQREIHAANLENLT